MKESNGAFEKKLREMKLPHQGLISREEEENAWKEILFEIDKKEKKQSLKGWLVAASIVLVMGLTYVFFPGENTTYITGADERLRIDLADGSEVTLNSSSQLEVDDAFGEELRSVTLKGEAFFNVQKNPDVPFVVTMQDRRVKVLGTSFILNHQHGNTIVAVRSGKVQISNETDSMVLEAEEKGMINPDGQLIRQTWEPNDLAWYNGTLIFQEKSLGEVVKILSQHTKKTVEITPELARCTLTARIEYERIEEVLDIIAETLEINWKEEPKRILFYGKGC